MLLKSRILFASYVDANDKMAMAGVPYHISRTLQKHCGDVTVAAPVDHSVVRIGQIVRRLSRLFGQPREVLENTIVSKLIALRLKKKMNGTDYDVVFVCFGHAVAAHFKTRCPLIYISDTTYSQIISYYQNRSDPPEPIRRENDLLEQKAIQNASLLLYPSRFAATSAVTDYHCAPEKVHVVPFGANLDDLPDAKTVREAITQRAKSGICRLLFIGKEWQRKGGSIALETFHALKRMNVPAEITFVGCRPPQPITGKNVTVIPTLNKNIPAEAQQLSDLLLSASFFLLPTRAEQFGIVFCEASAFGVPSITTDTGGVSSAVEDGINGYKLPLEAQGAEYAKLIAGIFRDTNAYAALAESSRDRYDDVLNWDSWGKSVSCLLKSL